MKVHDKAVLTSEFLWPYTALKKAENSERAMESQAKATNREYDRLMKEMASLQEEMNKVASTEGDDSKKDQ